MADNVPELGIYDTRLWDTDYKKWLDNKTNPTKHPDPNVQFNEEEGKFLWKDKEFVLKEYDLEKKRLW